MMEEQKIKSAVRKLVASDLRMIGRRDIEGPGKQRRWYALRTKVAKEAVAEVLMLQAGHLAFCPVEMVERRLNRFAKVKTPQPRPMLTGMILAGFDGDVPWFNIFRLNVITAVIGSGADPIVVPHRAVRRMLRMSGAAAELRKPAFKIAAGLRAVISDGPFEGIAGMVEACTDKRARMLLEIDGAVHPLDVPVELLAEAS